MIAYAPSAKATPYSIKEALICLEGVQHVDLRENFANSSITLTIAGGADDQISGIIADVRAAGIPATWQRPTPVPVSVSGNVSRIPSGDAPTVKSAVEADGMAYLGDLPIGDAVIYSDLVRTILSVDGVDDILSMSATAGSTTIQQFGQTLVIPAGQKASPGPISITVV